MDQDRKINEVLWKLDGLDLLTYNDFVVEQRGFSTPGEPYSERDTYIADSIIEAFEGWGFRAENSFVWCEECGPDEKMPEEMFSICYLDEGIRLYRGKEILGSVRWCYRGSLGDCWIKEGE